MFLDYTHTLQGESPNDYPYAYLVTAPRFLGYCFNPVSFWYLYSSDIRLRAMILEVNNTFDERRMYFLKGSKDIERLDPSGNPISEPTFTTNWVKDFHVSPFNSRNGSYSLIARDLCSNADGFRIDNAITLSSSRNHAKVVARLFSAAPPIDPLLMTVWQKLWFITSWWWVGFVTYPRIVKEAAKLFFRRRLHVWFRPEVIQTSVGRRESNRERYH